MASALGVIFGKKAMFYKETLAERQFREHSPYFHLHTQPLEDVVLFTNDEDRTVALNYVAITLGEVSCKLLALAMMSNHFHFVLSGEKEQVATFWDIFQRRLDTYFTRHGRPGIMRRISATPTPIADLAQLRTEIAYVIRNRFVVRTDVHVFADPWSSGSLYFNPLLKKEGVSAACLHGRELREFTRSRLLTEVNPSIYVLDGCAQIWSFVDYQLVESLYDNARQFVHSVLKNVEAQVETARRLGERPFLSDEELFPLAFRYSRDAFQADKLSNLDGSQRKQLAIWIKRKYSASNKQLARLSGLSIREVNELFPLSAPAARNG